MHRTDAGTYVEHAGRPAVRFERIYPHPVERVWRAITDPAELRHWFPSPEVSYEARVGGTLTLSGDPYAPEARTSTVLVWEPPHRFGFGWEQDELHFTLSEAEGGCRLVLLDVLSAGRLVTLGEGMAEVAHEALLREWPRLRDWLEEDAEGRRLHRQIGRAQV